MIKFRRVFAHSRVATFLDVAENCLHSSANSRINFCALLGRLSSFEILNHCDIPVGGGIAFADGRAGVTQTERVIRQDILSPVLYFECKFVALHRRCAHYYRLSL